MALTEAALRKLSKEGIISLPLDYQSQSGEALANINKESCDLSRNY